jgi:hypothetical protein
MFKNVAIWWKKKKDERQERLWPERKIIVECTEDLISAVYPSGKVETARWQSLEKIEILTNDSGPWGADVWFVITSKTGQCTYPQGATGEKEALDYLLAIDGFNEKEFIKSMGCTSNAQFICWQPS